MKQLILDTNIIVQDFQMTGNLFSTLFPNLGAIADFIVIPKVVQQEIVNQYRKKINAQRKKAVTALSHINKMSGMNVSVPALTDTETLVKQYETYLEEKIDTEKIHVVDYPSVSHEDIAQKAMHRKKPFKNNGEGYCDCLIWETIKEILSKNPEDKVVFLTNNSKDFLAENDLHSELVTELEDLKINPDRIEIFTSLKGLSDSKLFSYLQSLEGLKDEINNNKVSGVNLEEWLEQRLWGAFDESDLMFLFGELDERECTVELSEIYSVSSINVEEARVVSASKKYISFTASVGVGVNVCADYYDFHESKALQDFFKKYDGTEPLPYECVYVGEEIEFDISVIVEDDDFENSTLEIISMSFDSKSVDFTS